MLANLFIDRSGTILGICRNMIIHRLLKYEMIFSCDSSSIGSNVGRSVGLSVCLSKNMSKLSKMLKQRDFNIELETKDVCQVE